MANSEHGTEATVSRDGVTVYQTFTTEEFGVPTVALKLVSDRPGPVRVGLAVDLPADMEIEKLGFHPEYREDGWTVGEGEVTFEADLDPNGELTTMYAVDSPTSEQQAALLESLSVERVEPVSRNEVDTSTLVELDESDVQTLDPGDATGDSSSPDPLDPGSGGEAGGSAGTPTTAGPAAKPSETPASEEPADEPRDTGAGPPPTEVPTAQATAPSETTAPPETTAGGSSGSADQSGLSAYSAEELVAELDRRSSADGLTDETRQRIERLGPERANVGELEAKLSHLQKRMSDMEAYTDPVRDLHEEHGHPVEVIDGLERRLAEFGDRLDEIDRRVTAVDESVADIEPQFEEVAADVESVRSEVGTVKEDVESVESEQRRMASELSDLSEWRDTVTSALDALGGK